MLKMPDPQRADQRLSDLYRRNIECLGPGDIIVASCGGAGQSLIGNILFEAGLNYVDAYTEELREDGTAVGKEYHASYRQRLASLHDKDVGTGTRPGPAPWPRFVKTHLPPHVFAERPIGGVWLLLRDPRDALYSLYRWRRDFAEEDWDRVPGTFEQYLRERGDFTASPVDDWPAFYVAWRERARECEHTATVRFEDLKARPLEAVAQLLRPLPVDVPAERLRHAVEASTFERMRAHEDRVAADAPAATGARMIRSGKVSGWREWMTPELERFFAGEELRSIARQFGYELAC